MAERLKGSGRYLSFPFRMTEAGGAQSGRLAHVREEIVQVLLTGPGERVFLPEFGLGVGRLLFLPMNEQLWTRIETSLSSGIAEALRGEALPGSIAISAKPAGGGEQLDIKISYRLAALNKTEEMEFTVSDGFLVAPGSASRPGE